MLIYLNGIPLKGNKESQRVQSALPLSTIFEVTEVEQIPRFGNKWVFSIRLNDGQILCSESYKTKEEAEMHQFSTVSIINALEIVENLRKNGSTNGYEVAFDWVDVKNRELKRSLIDPNISIYTIKI